MKTRTVTTVYIKELSNIKEAIEKIMKRVQNDELLIVDNIIFSLPWNTKIETRARDLHNNVLKDFETFGYYFTPYKGNQVSLEEIWDYIE